MNIHDLEVIHTLLIEEKNVRQALMNEAAHHLYEMEDREENPFDLKMQKEAVDGYRERYYDISRVLDHFEGKEW